MKQATELTRRDVLAAGTTAALSLPLLARDNAPNAKVAIVRCRDYRDYSAGLSTGFDQIGGIRQLVQGKTVAIKVNLTGNPKNFPLTPDLPYRTNGDTVAKTVNLLARAGAKRIRLIESFFPANQDLSLWSATESTSTRSIISA